ncbi:MAG TPA: cell wall-binding repeat-containing protein, partial [Acidimicrobiales bacterium]|nr:cell wall-binding repeat-containing protein [Acidimicrobiales bacterium]
MLRVVATTVAIAVAVAVGSLGVPSAAADTLRVTDDRSDVTRQTLDFDTGETSSSTANVPVVDILGVSVTNLPTSVEIVVTMAEVVAMDDERWQESFGVGLSLLGPDGTEWTWAPDAFTGEGAYLESFDFDDLDDSVILSIGSDVGCLTDFVVDEDANTYTFAADETCAEQLPRSFEVLAGASDAADVDSDTTISFVQDVAPDEGHSAAVSTGAATQVVRLNGDDRIETAIALSRDRYDEGEAFAAVVASGAHHADALAGAPLAVANGGPLLLNAGGSLDPRVRDELVRALAPGADVFLLGGTAAIGADVEAQVRALGFQPERIAGGNRFETAAAIAAELPDHDMVLVADGRGYKEALVASAAAAAAGGVLVLTDGPTLPDATREVLATAPVRHVAIGSTAAAAAPGAEQIVAANVSALSVRVLDRLVGSTRGVSVASLGSFADGLAGATHAAAGGAGLLLTDGRSLDPAVRAALGARG